MGRLLALLILLAVPSACDPGKTLAVLEPKTDLVAEADQAAARLSKQLRASGRTHQAIRLGLFRSAQGDHGSPFSEMLLNQVAAGLARRGYEVDRSGSPSLPAILFSERQGPRDLELRRDMPGMELGGTYAVGEGRVFVSLFVESSAEQQIAAAYDFALKQDDDIRALLSASVAEQRYKRDLAGNYYPVP